jgi:hypothetical protein
MLEFGRHTTFYVEAKQYKDRNPRAMLVRAYRQVWSTWGRLRQQHHCPEGFLVVFRRSGALAELPLRVQTAGLVLHTVLVDLSEAAGSSESLDPIQLSADDVLPQAD